MPDAKTGSVTFELANAVKEIKAGRVEFRVDKFAIIHNSIGKKRFSAEQLYDNAKSLFRAILKARPASVKGTYVKSLAIAPTMGPESASMWRLHRKRYPESSFAFSKFL